MGDMQVDLLLRRLKDQGNIAAHTVPVRIPYRETIRKTAEAQGRHKKQTGGAGQFGDCWLRLEPNPGMGYEFVDEIVGGKIPRNYIPAVDKGVQDAMAEGFLAGYPMVDIKCAVYDGSYHPVDSNEMAFKTAARIGFRACCEKANPVLLEPIVNVAITAPEQYAGAVMGDISTRRGRIVAPTNDGRRHRHHGARAVRRGRALRQGPAVDVPRHRRVHHRRQRLPAGARRRGQEAHRRLPRLPRELRRKGRASKQAYPAPRLGCGMT